MEAINSTSRFTPEASLQGNAPHTPPYTPNPAKRRFERSDSPASIKSIQPTETISPSKNSAEKSVQDNVKVEELTEADAGYITDIDIVYPEELEEAESDSDGEHSRSEGDDSDTGITHHFSRLECEDGAEAEFERKRRAKHVRKRTDSRVFKRSHSQSVKSDVEMSDPVAMGDHDLSSSARRLRRRTRGPNGVKVVHDEGSNGSPQSRRLAPAAEIRDSRQDPFGGAIDTETPSGTDAMDVDDSD